MQTKGSLDRIRAKYPGYYQKKSSNWKKEKEIRDLAIKKNVSQMGLNCRQFVAYSNAINSMDENINKLFKLL
tara:strand:+ start:6625 stop:6840 length:216 start_codon:yes stop_codon:yes gene_type:complete